MKYHVKYEFLCNDHRLRGSVDKQMDESEVKGRSNDQIVASRAGRGDGRRGRVWGV